MRFSLRNVLLALVGVITLSPAGVSAKDRSPAVEIDKARLEAIKPIIERETAEGIRAGFVAGVITREGDAFITTSGMADREKQIPMAENTRFRIASMTKPIISAAMMQLVDRGVVSLSDPVSKYIPAYAHAMVATAYEPDKKGAFPVRPVSRPITIHDILTHTAGVGYVFEPQTTLGQRYLHEGAYGSGGTIEERLERIAALPLYEDPGKKWRYSYGIDIAAYVIEIAAGEPIETYLKKNIFDPLGMADTEFFFDETDFDRVATLYSFGEDGRLAPYKGDDLAGDLNSHGFGVYSGGGGLVSGVRDYLKFCEMMLRGGEVGGARILSPSSVRLMMSDNLSPEAAEGWREKGVTFGIGGSVVIEPGLTGDVAAPGEWSWSGYWDTWFVVNPADGVAVVLLAQTQDGPANPPSRARSLVKGVAYGAVANRR